ncbi:hypothetical protein E3P81_01801 [Wallemia ichthyophaga]|nr:hypothetical protein E3P98_01419 [Wallemia ichthyophaga]TIA91908.1 hypothetical protein E3P97_01800 [Wallemia ichthyophaga]TIB00952.1 hypothetical protein E3P95_01514 [Wallemia ichthyophaga]TIB01832.1 hypothetical protein E3P94_01646 [Wallemia ichthyophaga]TIB05296.1 hypothetical protein E3P96_01227 [Wallemia ichthyophaga]
MPKAEAGSSKAVGNAMKAKGLGRLRWYCQVCEKQCRDENGYKCHTQSESHLRAMLHVGENAGKFISDASQQFQREFVILLSRRHGTNRVAVNTVYQEFIADKHHLHMNATRWVTLTEFTKYLGRAGIVRVDETEQGLYVSWIDNSPQALARQEASLKKDRQHMDDEQRERKMIAEQIERAKLQGDGVPKEHKPSVLNKGDAPIKLSLNSNSSGQSSAPKISLKPAAAAAPASTQKPANVFKAAKQSKATPVTQTPHQTKPKSAMESLMIGNEERKKRLAEREQGQNKKVKL